MMANQPQVQPRLSRQKARTDVRKSYTIQFVPSYESDMSVIEEDDAKWLQKMFSAPSEHDAILMFEKQLQVIVARDKLRAFTLNYTRITVKFGHGRPNAIASVELSKSAEVSTGAIHIAAVNGWSRLIENLLSNGVHWNSDSDVLVDGDVALRNVTSLHWACAYDRRGVIQVLVKRDDFDVDVRDGEKATPLMYAAQFGHRNVIDVLLRHGADVNAVNDKGVSALVVAARSGRGDMVKFLLDNGAELSDQTIDELSKYDHLNRIDAIGNTALHIACVIGRDDLVASLAIARQRSSASYLNDYLNVSNAARQTGLHLATTAGSLAIVGRLRSMGARRDCKDSFGNTPLHVACLEGNVELVNCLMGEEIDYALLTSANGDGWTPVHCAVAGNNPEVLRSVLDRLETKRGVHRLPADIDGNTPLHLAAKVNCSEKVIMELKDCDPFARNNDGACPIHLAARFSSEDTLSVLLQTFYSSSTSSSSSRHHADVDHANADGDSALFICIRSGNVGKVRLLLENDAGLFPGGPGTMTALHQLANLRVDDQQSRKNIAEIYKLLVDREVALWFVKRGMTSAQPTFTANHREALRCAVDQLVRDVTYDGLNAMQYAARRKAFELLRLVVQTSNAYVGSNDSYDVTYLIPRTVPAAVVNEVDGIDRGSVIEYVAQDCGDSVADDLLSQEPFDAVVKPYVTLCRVVQCCMLLLHLIDMTLFTWCTVPERSSSILRDTMAELNATEPIQAEQYGLGVNVAYGAFLIWPLLNFVIDAAQLTVHLSRSTSLVRARFDRRQLVGVVLSSSFAVSSAIWCLMYFRSGNGRFYACVLSAIYITGWTYTLTQLRMFQRTSRIVATIVTIFYDDVVPFFVIYVFQLISFSFAFSVLTSSTNMAPNDEISRPNRTMSLAQVFYSSFALMLGMDSFGDYLSPINDDESVYKIIVQVTFVLYESVTAIVLLNLLIAMMNKTFGETLQRVSRELDADTLRMVAAVMSVERRLRPSDSRFESCCRGFLRRAVDLMSTRNKRSDSLGHRVGVPYETANRWYITVRSKDDRSS